MESLEDVVSRLNADVVSKFENGNQEEVQEQAVAATTEAEQPTENVQAESSLTSEENIAESEHENANVVSLTEVSAEGERTFDEKEVLGYLSKKLGKELSSLEDLTQPQQNEDRPAIVTQLEKWMKETGYNDIGLYLQTQATDYASMDTKSLIINDYMVTKGLNAEQAELYYDKNFGREEADADVMDESELRKVEKLNKTKEIEETLAAKEAKARFQQLKEKYATPTQERSQSNGIQEAQAELQRVWSESSKQAMDSIKEIVVPITKEKGYKFSFSDYVTKNQESLSSPDKFFQRFLNENGTWDMPKLMKAAAISENLETMASSLYGQGLSDGQKAVVTSGKNLNFDKAQKSNAPRQTELEAKVQKSLNEVMARLNPSVFNR